MFASDLTSLKEAFNFSLSSHIIWISRKWRQSYLHLKACHDHNSQLSNKWRFWGFVGSCYRLGSCLHVASRLMLPALNSTSLPLYHNMLVSHLSIRSIPSIFICMASHSLSQSIFLPRKCSCCLPVNLSLSVSISFFVVFLCMPSFFFPALWETLNGLCCVPKSPPWWPALSDSS